MAYQQQHDGYSQPRQQPYYDQAPPPQRYQQASYDNRYDQQHYDQGYAQDDAQQWDTAGQYNHGHQEYHDQNRYAPQDSHAQGQRQPPQHHPISEQGHRHQYRQQHPQQRQDPRSRPMGRGNGLPPNPQRGRGGLRPPGLDRSLFNPTPQTSLPLDNPFPTFPAQKTKQPAPVDAASEAMSQMSINDREGHNKRNGSLGGGQPVPSQDRGAELHRSESNNRQDSGHFEGSGQNPRSSPHQLPPNRRPPPMNTDASQSGLRQRLSDPKSPSQRSFGPNTQRSMTAPQDFHGATHGEFNNRQHWDEAGATGTHRGPASPIYMPPRPSTAGGVRQHESRGQQPPMPPLPPQQHRYNTSDQHNQVHDEGNATIDTFYDDYYGASNNERKSMASTIDMPNFDAIPEVSTRHRRGDSIDNHLDPGAGPSHGIGQSFSSTDAALAHDADFQRTVSRSRSQPNFHEQYINGSDYDARDAPPVPNLPRANTGFAGANGPPTAPRGRGLPPRGMAMDGMQREHYNQANSMGPPSSFDPRFARQPQPVQRGYSNESAYSEPPQHVARNFSSPVGPGNPIHRPGTAGPALGRPPFDPLGRRPGTTQPLSNPDSLPAHPAPVRAGLMQQQSTQPLGPPNARPPPVRQYDNDPSYANYERQYPAAQRPNSVPHPVTHDELNRLRNTWKANPNDNAIGLKLAKKLVEAASVLADEGGTADTRTRNKNREKSFLEAHKIVKKLVGGGYPEAMFYLADCYGQGLLGLQADTKEAFALYQSAAKAGHAASAYRTAVCCEMGHEEGGGTKKDPLKAVQWYRRAAALGDTPALYKMGMVLLKGLLGQQRNLGEALNMLKRAADQADRENPHALHELALIYESQTGNERIIRDEAYALQLLHQAADLGYKFSQFRLGQAYEYGLLGCQIDARTSIAWYTKAAAQEEHQSELALSGWYLTGIQGVLEQSDTEAYLWARKAACAEPPLPKALFAMGYFTEVGIGCPRSLDEAKRWYGRAAAYKFPKAQERLEELKRGGSKVQLKRERLSRTNQKQQEENCTVM